MIDMLKGFHDMGKLANPRTAKIISAVRELLERRVERDGWKVVFLGDQHERGDKEFKIFPEHCILGTEEVEIIDELKRFLGVNDSPVLIPKTRYDGFYNTYLDEVLSAMRPKMVIVVGVCTDICVLYTAAGLRERDYQVIVPKDCTETYSAPGHNAKRVKRLVYGHMKDILGVKVIKSQKEI
ncbi:MAG: cysteine hydrolase [Candidatus Omnitrophica bacterium]|nr:cysteine hydrolase [Candidatus Omnitrophota bacterium]